MANQRSRGTTRVISHHEPSECGIARVETREIFVYRVIGLCVVHGIQLALALRISATCQLGDNLRVEEDWQDLIYHDSKCSLLACDDAAIRADHSFV